MPVLSGVGEFFGRDFRDRGGEPHGADGLLDLAAQIAGQGVELWRRLFIQQ
jgi:hypothetical protein